MTEDKHNNSEKASRKRPPKSRHIDVRFTEDEFNIVLKYAREGAYFNGRTYAWMFGLAFACWTIIFVEITIWICIKLF